MFKLNSKYVEIIMNLCEISSKGGFLYLPEDNKNVLYDDVIKISIESLYCKIIIGLFYEFETSSWRDSFKKDIEYAEYFIKNRSKLKEIPYVYERVKIHVNSLYSKIPESGRLFINEYVKLIWSDLLKIYKDKILYIDTDYMILNVKKCEFNSIPELYELGYTYTTQCLDYVYFIRSKNYVEVDESGYKCKGNLNIKHRSEELLLNIKYKIRNKKLNKLGI